MPTPTPQGRYARAAREPLAGEQIVDVAATSRAFDRARRILAGAIRREARRQIRAAQDRGRTFVVLTPTQGMAAPLRGLYRWARSEARREMGRLGIEPVAFADADPAPQESIPYPLRPVWLGFQAELGEVEVRINRAMGDVAIGEGIGTVPTMALNVLATIPGASGAAAQVVSRAYTAGLDDIYRTNEDVFGGWLYSAMLDGGTCAECRGKDGRRYETLAEAEIDLPGFGPNPYCRGGGRCRCRLVPLP